MPSKKEKKRPRSPRMKCRSGNYKVLSSEPGSNYQRMSLFPKKKKKPSKVMVTSNSVPTAAESSMKKLHKNTFPFASANQKKSRKMQPSRENDRINISKKSLSLSFILNVYYLLFWKHHSECIVIHIFGIVVMRDWYLAATFLIAIWKLWFSVLSNRFSVLSLLTFFVTFLNDLIQKVIFWLSCLIFSWPG